MTWVITQKTYIHWFVPWFSVRPEFVVLQVHGYIKEVDPVQACPDGDTQAMVLEHLDDCLS